MRKPLCKVFLNAGKNSVFRRFNTLLWLLLAFIFLTPFESLSQGIIPTKGKEFWIAFPFAPGLISGNGASKRCDVFITSENNTSGIISIPTQGWNQSFNVTANQTTTISIPVLLAEHLTSDVIENKGVQVITQDTVSVFSISFQEVSADAAVVYPKQSLGTNYRIGAYPGINAGSNPGLTSCFLVIASEDDTQFEITPTAATYGGHPAGMTYTVKLDKGESYQVLANSWTGDFTGTTVNATDSSGSCRPFAVFSGSTCVNIPSGCFACDVLYEQSMPVEYWGKTYYSVPFSFSSLYTLRILADQNNTTYSIDGGTPSILNAGQFVEINNIAGTQCVSADKPVSVIQYMQGITCAGSGDPSMMFLNAHEQKIDKVTFSTVTSNVITQHDVNVIMNTSHIGQLKLDGVQVPASEFTAMSFCSNISYAQLPLTQGSHTLEADSGFTAYAYGTGSAESYAYSVGAFSKSKPIQVDSVICANDTAYIGTNNMLFNAWWSTLTNPNDTIGTGPVLTLLPPVQPDVYVQHGNEFISGCEKIIYYNVEIPAPPAGFVSASATTACQFQQVQLVAGTIPASSIFNYSWSPVTGLSNPNIPNPVLTVTTSGWYRVNISSPNGCAPVVIDSIFINMLSLPLPVVDVGSDQTICFGDSITLNASGGISYVWNPGNATTNSIIVSPGVTTNYIVFATNADGCANSDTVRIHVTQGPATIVSPDQTVCQGFSVVLSVFGGLSYLWTNTGETSDSIIVTPSATTEYIVETTGINSCLKRDTVLITVVPKPVANAGPDQSYCAAIPATLLASGGLSYLWSPGNSTSSFIQVTPPVTTIYSVRVTDGNGCEDIDSVTVVVTPLVTGASRNETICFGETITLADSAGLTYSWTPGGSTDSVIIASPAITTDFIVEKTTVNGCLIFDTVSVNVNQLPAANAGNDTEICLGDSATLIGSGGINYFWHHSGEIDSTITVVPILITEYILQVTDINGCINSDSVLVIVNPLPVTDAGPNQFICPGEIATLQASGGVNYEWLHDGSTTSSIDVTPFIPTSFIVRAYTLNNCTNLDTVLVDMHPLPSAQFGITGISCVSEPLTFDNQSLISSGIISLNGWDFGDGNFSSVRNPVHTYNAANDYNVRLIISSDNGCLDTVSHMITVNVKPSVNFSTQVTCALQPAPFTDLSTVQPGTINQWLWEFGDGSTSDEQNPMHTYTLAGNYDVSLRVTTDSGCSATRLQMQGIKINPLPVSQFIAQPEIASILQPDISFVDSSIDGVTWEWDFGDSLGNSTFQNVFYSYKDTGVFHVRLLVMNNFGCYDTSYGDVYIEPFYSLYFPNAFTPNGDNVNDYFSPYGEGVLDLELLIFDRWGNLIYHSSGVMPHWDGSVKNKDELSSEGVYTFLAKVTDYRHRKKEIRGSVTLIR